MGEDKLNSRPSAVKLMAEEGASLSSGSLRLYAFDGDTAVGAVDLYEYDPVNRRCAMGLVVSTEHRHKGYGKLILRQLDIVAAVNYRLHQLYVDIVATNTASLSLLRSAGYVDCGHFAEWLLVDEQYIDSIRLQKLL